MNRNRYAAPAALIAFYLALVVVWVGFAWAIAPRLLAEAYDGHGITFLNRLLARTARKPLEHYLGLWRSFAWAVIAGLGAHAIVTGFIRSRRLDRSLARFLVGISAGFLAFTVLVGPRQDYAAYCEIWDHTQRGGDPWWIAPVRGYPLNAYGPLFVTFTPLAFLNPLAPKILFAACYLLLTVELTTRSEREPRFHGWPRTAMLAFLINPWFWLEMGWYGHFDVLIGMACLGSVVLSERGRDGVAGGVLGLGILLKFLPAVLGPVLTLAGRRFRLRFALVAAAVTIVGMTSAWAVWSSAAWRPLTFAATRPSQFLSIFRFLRGAYSPLRLLTDHPDLDWWSLPSLLLAQAGVCLVAWRRRLDVGTAAMLGVLVTLLLYKVGFPQYHTVLFVLVPYWCLTHPDVFRFDPRIQAALASYCGWIVVIGLFDYAVGGIVGGNPHWAWAEDLTGVPTFLLGTWFALELIIATHRCDSKRARSRSSQAS